MNGLEHAHLRVARPTDRLDEVTRFYKSVLGFEELGRFQNHQGFDGVMLGHRHLGYHLEFTHAHGHHAPRAPTQDHLLVFYIPDVASWRDLTQRIEASGVIPVKSLNPYWDQNGKTYEDPDGYRVVIQNSVWTFASE